MKIRPILFSAICAVLLFRPILAADDLSITSKDETIYFTKKLIGFRPPVAVKDTTDQSGGTLTISDADGVRVIKIERIPFGSSPMAPKPVGTVGEAYFKAVLAEVRARDYPTEKKRRFESTKQEGMYEAYGVPCLIAVDELLITNSTPRPDPRVARGYLVFAATHSVVVVQYDNSRMVAPNKRVFLSADYLQWIARNLQVKDV